MFLSIAWVLGITVPPLALAVAVSVLAGKGPGALAFWFAYFAAVAFVPLPRRLEYLT